MITIVDPDPEYDPDPDFRPDRDARREFSVGIAVVLVGSVLVPGLFVAMAFSGDFSVWAFAFPAAVLLFGTSMLFSPEWPHLAALWQTVRAALRIGAAGMAATYVLALVAGCLL